MKTGYVALLRGINVGGHTMVKMEELRRVFVEMGFRNVRTLLNSGNVVFEAGEINLANLRSKIEKQLEKAFGFAIRTLVRTAQEIQDLVKLNPFKGINVAPRTRLYVTFLSEKPTNHLQTPYESPEKDFRILWVSHGAVFSVLTLSPKRGSVDLMSIIEKEFGKKVTTRNWNTVQKIAAL